MRYSTQVIVVLTIIIVGGLAAIVIGVDRGYGILGAIIGIVSLLSAVYIASQEPNPPQVFFPPENP